MLKVEVSCYADGVVLIPHIMLRNNQFILLLDIYLYLICIRYFISYYGDNKL